MVSSHTDHITLPPYALLFFIDSQQGTLVRTYYIRVVHHLLIANCRISSPVNIWFVGFQEVINPLAQHLSSALQSACACDG